MIILKKEQDTATARQVIRKMKREREATIRVQKAIAVVTNKQQQ